MNTQSIRFYAPVPVAHQEQGIKFLVLEYDMFDIKGWFIYLHDALENSFLFDLWRENKSLAENIALLSYGVTPDLWKKLE
jgi:hypothetical protein